MALTDNLISYWKLDEASGTRNDAHSTNHLTDVNTVASATGKINSAASFAAASSEILERASNSALTTAGSSFAFAFWFNVSSGAECGLAYKSEEWSFDWENSLGGTFWFRVDGAGGEISRTAITGVTTSQWWHAVGSYDRDNDIIGSSLNAGTPQTTAHSEDTYPWGNPFRLGQGRERGYLSGLIDEFGFWKDRILTSTERTDLYNGGSGLAYPFTVAAAGNPWPLYRQMRVNR